jgi:hypothetical protein
MDRVVLLAGIPVTHVELAMKVGRIDYQKRGDR